MGEGATQLSLGEEFDGNPPWEHEWWGMPEFISVDLTSVKQVIVHFETFDDMAAFAALVEQTITPRTQSIWYPEAAIGRFAGKAYIDES